MITKLNVTAIQVLDQDEALDFYVNKLGLEVGNDFKQGTYRWLTVRVPNDPGMEIHLELPGPPAQDEATAEQLRELITKGAMGFTVAFQTDDCRALYEELKRRGVTDFIQEPTDHGYGVDMGIRDPFGNAIRILQPRASAANGSAKEEPVATALVAPAPGPGAAQNPSPASRPTLPAAPVAALVRRGDTMLAIGDISAARLLYQRAASTSGQAATAAGKTYDPAFLAQIGARGIRPDPAAAAEWYRKALALGDGEADQLLRRLPASSGR